MNLLEADSLKLNRLAKQAACNFNRSPKAIILRPHHFLCIPGYKGYGYSKEFEVHMEKIINSLKQGTKTKITLGYDDICAYCVQPADNICSNSFVEKVDQTVMGILGLREGQIVDFNEKLDDLKNILNPASHKRICSECIWMKKGLCADTFK